MKRKVKLKSPVLNWQIFRFALTREWFSLSSNSKANQLICRYMGLINAYCNWQEEKNNCDLLIGVSKKRGSERIFYADASGIVTLRLIVIGWRAVALLETRWISLTVKLQISNLSVEKISNYKESETPKNRGWLLVSCNRYCAIRLRKQYLRRTIIRKKVSVFSNSSAKSLLQLFPSFKKMKITLRYLIIFGIQQFIWIFLLPLHVWIFVVRRSSNFRK